MSRCWSIDIARRKDGNTSELWLDPAGGRFLFTKYIAANSTSFVSSCRVLLYIFSTGAERKLARRGKKGRGRPSKSPSAERKSKHREKLGFPDDSLLCWTWTMNLDPKIKLFKIVSRRSKIVVHCSTVNCTYGRRFELVYI